MPGAGKSTSGRLLAKLLDMHFIDIDELIRDFDYKPATTIKNGVQAFARWFRDYYQIAS